MSQNFYDASGNFKAGNYLDGMWSGPPGTDPRQRGVVAPFNAVSLAKDTSQQPLGSSPQAMSQNLYDASGNIIGQQAGLLGRRQEVDPLQQQRLPSGPTLGMSQRQFDDLPQVDKEFTKPTTPLGMPMLEQRRSFMPGIENMTKAAVDPTTLPPQIGQQQFGGFGGGAGLGSLGGNGQTNVSLNLQGSATMNGGNQNRGYPGMNSGSGTMGGGASGGAMGYAEGGDVSAAPQGLAALGRGNDTQLVHMTPREVHGLQQLALAHGGSLTTNPHTGLLEAGFLERLLPAAAAAMAYPTMGAEGAALVGGAVTTATTNDFRKGIANGMMIYGLGNAAEGIEKMGAEKNAIPQQGGLEKAGITQVGEAGAGQSPFANKVVDNAMSSDVLSNDIANGTYTNLPSQSQIMAQQNAKIAEVANATPSNLQTGLGRFANKPFDAAKELYGNMNKFGVAGLGAGALTAIDRFSNKPPTTAPAPVATKPFTPRYTPQTRFPTEEERKRLGSGEYNYFPTAAAGGSTEDIKGMAQGGIASTLDYAAGGKLLSGAGDGMSDSIPAVIQGNKPQRAALADGEFVIPADVVSHLGNGSTKAGAQHLYKMMDKIRKARTGNPKQGKQINPHKFLRA